MFKYTDITGKEPVCPCCKDCRLKHINSNKWDCERCKKVFKVKRKGLPYPAFPTNQKETRFIRVLKKLRMI